MSTKHKYYAGPGITLAPYLSFWEGLNIQNTGGGTALYAASQQGHTDIVRLLKNAGAK
jgi:ankyrin repeat protein